MSNKAFDDKLRRLENESSISAPSFVWDQIESSLDQTSNTRWMWLIKGLVILCTALSTSWLLESTTPHKNLSNNSTKNSIKTAAHAENNQTININTTPINSPTNEPTSTKVLDTLFANDINNAYESKQQKLQSPIITLKPAYKSVNASINTISERVLLENNGVTHNETIASLTKMHHNLRTKQSILLPVDKRKFKPNTIALLDKEQETIRRTKKNTIQSFLEAGGIVGHHQQQFGSLTDLTRLRESTESEWYSYGAFLRYSAKLSTNWYASLGYQHTTHKDKFYLEQQNAIRFNVINAEDTLYGPDTSFTTGTYISQGEIKHKSFDFTLSTSFVKPMGNWELGGEVTAIYNYNQKSTGKTLALNGSETRLENEGSNTYKTSLGFGYQLGGVINYTINNRYSLSLRPFYKSYFGDWNTANSVETFRINSYGIQLGTRLAF
jgi:hypothetical protein